MQHLGLPDERVFEVAWAELDHAVVPDHLTSLYVAEMGAPIAREVARFADLAGELRRRCPWDREQTHQSLRGHLLEETYEVLEALDTVDPDSLSGYEELEEELGDLLYQIVFHSVLAAEAGQFTLADVARGIHDKLKSRHPHVFGPSESDQAAPDDASQVLVNWEAIKREQKGRSSVMDGIPPGLPALFVRRQGDPQGPLGGGWCPKWTPPRWRAVSTTPFWPPKHRGWTPNLSYERLPMPSGSKFALVKFLPCNLWHSLVKRDLIVYFCNSSHISNRRWAGESLKDLDFERDHTHSRPRGPRLKG